MPSLSKSLRKASSKKSTLGSVWKGPEEDGITYSLLSRFLCCRERFRLLVVEGLQEEDRFNHRIEYGQMWHTCEESLARLPRGSGWQEVLKTHCQSLCSRYPLQQEQVQHWYNVCKVQFPSYLQYWAKHSDVKDRAPLLQEQVFDMPYELPSGRVVRLRGKWDAVDLVGKSKRAAIYLQENKTKGDIVEEQLKKQLQSDLQTMLYLVALMAVSSTGLARKGGIHDVALRGSRIAGVRYNVVRRPLSGGRDSIRQKQDESAKEFYVRLGGLIADHPEHYFMRWRVEVSPADIRSFRHRCLDPLLENLCDWWCWITSPAGQRDPFGDHVHWQTPYGVYNVLLEGGSTPLDEYLATGSELGLRHTDCLFPELEELSWKRVRDAEASTW